MTLQELYNMIGGDYEQAIRVLRMDKLIDKHIRKLTKNDVFTSMIAAGESMDATLLFETSHAVKGVCGNLGLPKLAAIASEITEEYRPGSPRKFSDEEIREKLKAFSELCDVTAQGIRQYEESNS